MKYARIHPERLELDTNPQGEVRTRTEIQLRAFLTATTLIYAIGAGITAAAGTRLALQ